MNIVGKLVWRAQAVMAQVEAQVQQNMDKAAIYLVNDVVRSFGSPSAYPEGGVRVRNFGKAGTHKQSEKNYRAGQHSLSGDPPFKQHGGAGLAGSIDWEAPSKLTRLVGSTLRPQGTSRSSYALALEYGAPSINLLPRPYLRPALARCRAALFRIISGH